MTKINNMNAQNKINPTILSSSEVPVMKDLVNKYFMQLRLRAEREVPEYGDFANVYERFENPDRSLCASDFVLRIVKPPKTVDGNEKIRNLELVAYRLPSPYKASTILATGTKEELLNKFKEDDICEKIEESLRLLSKDLEDV